MMMFVSLEKAEHLTSHGKQSILCLALLVCMAFAFPIRLFTSNHKFARFYPSNSLSHRTGRGVSKQLPGAWLLAGVKP